ncbi:universal stress protein [Comamonas nitrativorans]|uniref:Universal stress protein n=1 Tax=Comamonas nitrativorans TaxID=108437 RepID=A0ABV9H2L3_9BURK|nr:universal stress protein [Comamonas sp.]
MTILVAYAPRPEGEAALEKGIETATRRNERLIVVNAAPGGPQEDRDIVPGHEAERLEQRLQALPVPAEFKMFVRGHDTLEEIQNLVHREQVSLLVIGLRRRSAVGKLLLGSLAHDILMSVPCPVLAVKAE